MVVEGVYGGFCVGRGEVVIKTAERIYISSKSSLFKLSENSNVWTCATMRGVRGMWVGTLMRYDCKNMILSEGEGGVARISNIT